MHDDDNELYELDKHTATNYTFWVVVPESTGKPVVYVACQRHGEPAALPYRVRALASTNPQTAARAEDVWSVLEFIERHEHEQHGAAKPVPYVPAAPFRNTAPAVTVVAVPPGTMGAALFQPGLQLRHHSARPVLVRTTRLANGGHLTTLPADGFPGAVWEIGTPPRPAPHPYVLGAPVPATGPAERCTRCGGPLDPHAVELPVGIGSRAANRPATLCRGCYELFTELTVGWVLGPASLTADPAAQMLTCGHPVPDRWISTGCVICRSYVRLSGMEPPAVVKCGSGTPHAPGDCPHDLPDSQHGPDVPAVKP